MVDLGKAQKSYEFSVKTLKEYQKMRQKAEAVFDNCLHNERSARQALDNARDALDAAVRTVKTSD